MAAAKIHILHVWITIIATWANCNWKSLLQYKSRSYIAKCSSWLHSTRFRTEFEYLNIFYIHILEYNALIFLYLYFRNRKYGWTVRTTSSLRQQPTGNIPIQQFNFESPHSIIFRHTSPRFGVSVFKLKNSN